MASIAQATSLSGTSIALAISSRRGSSLLLKDKDCFACSALYAMSRRLRVIFSDVLSRRNRFISPIIIGTAYVLKRTPILISKLSIDFINPIMPTWKTSSILCSLISKRWTIDKTNLRLYIISKSFCDLSPCLYFLSTSCISLAVTRGRVDVSRPHITTLFDIFASFNKYC